MTTRAIALLLTFLTGFSGLVYEVSWQKYLATLLGSHSEATAAVLGLYLGGLAAGYAIFGWVARRAIERASRERKPSPLLLIYGIAESSIGVWALLFPFLFGAVQSISFWVPPGHEGASFAFDVFLCLLLIAPPTILMGGTIPILTQALTRGLTDATRLHAFVYAFNTAGAFAGSLAAGFVLIHWLGLDGVLRAMGGVNLFAGAVFVGLGLRRDGPIEEAALHATPADAPLLRFAPLATVALLAGFAMMILQTTFNRTAALALGSSHFTFAMVVAVFVLCIALGSFTVSALSRIPAWLVAASQWLLVGLLVLIYLAVPDAGWAAHVLRCFFRDIPQGFYPYQAAVFLSILAILVVPIGLSGALLPLIFHHLRNELGDLGRMAGSLYSWNTVGSLLGALLGGYVLLFWLDLDDVYTIALGALAIGAGILTVRVARAPWLPTTIATVGVLVGIFVLPAWDPMSYAVGRFRQRRPTEVTFAGPTAFISGHNQGTRLLFHDDDPINTVTVIDQPKKKNAISILNNGKSDGSTASDYTTMGLAGVLPPLLSDDPSRAFVIGWGTGVTAGELGALEDTKDVLVAEISPAVIEAARYFSDANQHADLNPQIHPLRRDALRALMRSEGRFGVIVSEPPNPWVTGVEMLYSREFLEAARAKLTPHGILAQWMHLYEVDEATVQIVAHTYASVFENVAVWFTAGPDILLIGFNSPEGYPDVETLRARAERPDYRAALARCGVPGFVELLAHEQLPPGLMRAGKVPGELHTLRHPVLSQHAARAFFAGLGVELPTVAGGPDANGNRPRALLTRLYPPDRPMPEDVAESVTRHLCEMRRPKECATWLARWRADHPDSELARKFVPFKAGKGAGTQELQPDVIARIERMFRGELPDTPYATNPLARATQLTGLFAGHYVHAIPFDRQLLRNAWSDCQGNRSLDSTCQQARQAADDRLEMFEMKRVGGRDAG